MTAAGTTATPARRADATRSAGMPRLRPYQAAVVRAVLSRVLDHEGGSVSVEIARQGGKNELSAQLELVTLLAHATRGGTLVKCAPTYTPQAALSLARLRDRAHDAGLGAHLEVHANVASIGRAHARYLSAEPTANVVGHTADLLMEVDEAQNVDAETFDRAFRPMAASTNAPVVFYGTPWSPRSLLAQAKATHIEAEHRDGVRRHFRYDWEQVARYVPAYAAYVEQERVRLGERHPLFRTQYLLEVLDEADRMLDGAALSQIEGDHDRLHTPQSGERYVAGLDLAGPGTGNDARDRDWTVLTVARIAAAEDSASPRIEVVEHQAWQGEATEQLLAQLADRLRRVWKVRRVAVDATGLGGPVADLLASRLGHGVVEPFVFSAERKSRLGFRLLAAVHSGRLRLYRMDGSSQWAECRRQLERARVAYRADRSMQFAVDTTEGHDDYLMSLALTVWAARQGESARAARGRLATSSTHMERISA